MVINPDMTLPRVGFVGAGRVTRILVGGWRHVGLRLPSISAYDVDVAAVERVRTIDSNVEAVTEQDICSHRDVLFLAVHPQALSTVLSSLAGRIPRDMLVVYLGAKISLASLSRSLGGHIALARVIPNAPSIVGAGYNPIATMPGLSASHRSLLAALFDPLGKRVEVEEQKLEAYVLLTGMGPTYFWFQLDELRRLGIDLGLSETEVVPALQAMVTGAARTLFESGLPPDVTMDLVPAKPLEQEAPAIAAAYRSRLPALFAKIKPSPP
jgi:pyrroline-5-carboxylate reductase